MEFEGEKGADFADAGAEVLLRPMQIHPSNGDPPGSGQSPVNAGHEVGCDALHLGGAGGIDRVLGQEIQGHGNIAGLLLQAGRIDGTLLETLTSQLPEQVPVLTGICPQCPAALASRHHMVIMAQPVA